MKKTKKTKKTRWTLRAKLQALGLHIANHKARYALIAWFSFSWSWILFTDTLDLAGNKAQGFIIAVFVLCINVALSTAVMVSMFRVVKAIFNKFHLYIALGLGWAMLALADFLVAWVPAVFWIGPEGRLDSILPLSSPALIAVNTPLVFATRLIGFFGLSGGMWLLAYLLWNKKFRSATIVVGFFALLSIIGWQLWKTANGTTFKATVISETLLERVPAIDANQTNVVVFPEYGLDNITNDNLHERLTRTTDGTTYFVGSKQVMQQNRVGHLNRQIHGNSTDGITREQDKYRLIPAGEDLPYLGNLILRATNQKATLDYFINMSSTIKGLEQLQALETQNNISLGAAVCSSIISPEDYRHFTTNGATVLANSASLTTFQGSPLFSWQQKSMATFMAVANSRYFLQSANSARAYALDNNGKTLVEVTGKKTATTNVTNNSKKTLYSLAGEYIVLAGTAILTVLVIQKLKCWKRS